MCAILSVHFFITHILFLFSHKIVFFLILSESPQFLFSFINNYSQSISDENHLFFSDLVENIEEKSITDENPY